MEISWNLLARALDEGFSTPEQEIVCSECSAFIPALVDAQIAGTDPAVKHPDAWGHVQRCPDCLEEYEGLLHMMRLVEADALPEPEEYPSFSFPTASEVGSEKERSWIEQARETMVRIATQVRRGQAYAHAAVQIQNEAGIEKIAFALTPVRLVTQPAGERGRLPSRYLYKLGDLDLEITVGMRAFEQDQKTVKGQIFLGSDNVQDVAGVTARLVGGEGPSHTTVVDETGSFTFIRVPAGDYHITLELGDSKVVQLERLTI